MGPCHASWQLSVQIGTHILTVVYGNPEENNIVSTDGDMCRVFVGIFLEENRTVIHRMQLRCKDSKFAQVESNAECGAKDRL